MAQDASGPTKYSPSYVPTPRTKKHEKCCQCPACAGLECLERPRYFAGQLLTEAELNSEQSYVIAKNRLHNRYLHGWGVVCGLEVVCHNCAGWVTVRAGYALDPCGNDVIVCRDTEFNVLDAIQKCVDARRRRDDDCAPWRDPNDRCTDDDEHWCVTLQYVENEGRPVMPLQESKSHCGCGGGSSSKCGGGCDCGGSGKKSGGGGCSCGDKQQKSSSKKVACEPTRIFEQYRLGVIPEPEECATKRAKKEAIGSVSIADRDGGASVSIAQKSLIGLSGLIPDFIRKHPLFPALVMAAPDDSIFMRALQVGEEMEAFLKRRFTAAELETLRSEMTRCMRQTANPDAPATGNQGNTYQLCCKLRRAVRDLYAENPFNVRCQPFDCPPCVEDTPPPPSTEPLPEPGVTGAQPQDAVAQQPQNPMCCLLDALVNYFVDALCTLFLPTCPQPPCDDRLIIACVTVKKGKIVHICNHSCRHYAGSFNSVQHWMSAFPVIPLIGQILRDVCCSENGFQVLLGLAGRTNATD
jgi:hypothetical protein